MRPGYRDQYQDGDPPAEWRERVSSERTTEPVPLEYRAGNLPLAPDDVEREAESSIWFSYIALLIILTAMLLGMLFVVLGVVYLLSR